MMYNRHFLMQRCDEEHQDVIDRLWEMRRKDSSGELCGECFQVFYDLDGLRDALELFERAFESKNVVELKEAVSEVASILSSCPSVSVEFRDVIRASNFIPKLVSAFDSDDANVIFTGLIVICHLVIKDEMFAEFLDKNGFLDKFVSVLSEGMFADVMFLIFGFVEDEEIIKKYRKVVLENVSLAMNTDGVEMNVVFGAIYCCRHFTKDYVDESFVASVLGPFRSVVLKILTNKDSRSIEAIENVMYSLENWCNTLSVVRLMNENQFIQFLFQILPFSPTSVLPPCLSILTSLIDGADEDEAERLNTCVDIAWLFDQLREESDKIFVAVLDLLNSLTKTFQGFVQAMIEGGLVDIITSKLEDMRFPAKRATIILINSMIREEPNDQVLMPLLDSRIVNTLLELYELDQSGVGTLARLYAMSFDVPDIHDLLRDIIEQ